MQNYFDHLRGKKRDLADQAGALYKQVFPIHANVSEAVNPSPHEVRETFAALLTLFNDTAGKLKRILVDMDLSPEEWYAKHADKFARLLDMLKINKEQSPVEYITDPLDAAAAEIASMAGVAGTQVTDSTVVDAASAKKIPVKE